MGGGGEGGTGRRPRENGQILFFLLPIPSASMWPLFAFLFLVYLLVLYYTVLGEGEGNVGEWREGWGWVGREICVSVWTLHLAYIH